MKEIEEIIEEFLNGKPRLLCTCAKFVLREYHPAMAWAQCECRGWMSDLMKYEKELFINTPSNKWRDRN